MNIMEKPAVLKLPQLKHDTETRILLENNWLVEFDHLATEIAGQNAAFSDEEVSADIATAIDEIRRNKSRNRPLSAITCVHHGLIG
jgi:hypothetical protein